MRGTTDGNDSFKSIRLHQLSIPFSHFFLEIIEYGFRVTVLTISKGFLSLGFWLGHSPTLRPVHYHHPGCSVTLMQDVVLYENKQRLLLAPVWWWLYFGAGLFQGPLSTLLCSLQVSATAILLWRSPDLACFTLGMTATWGLPDIVSGIQTFVTVPYYTPTVHSSLCRSLLFEGMKEMCILYCVILTGNDAIHVPSEKLSATQW